MNKNWHCKIGTKEQLIVIQNLVWNIWGKKPSLKQIKVYSDGHIWLYGLPFLRWDRHHHYTDPREQPVVDYLFLRAIEDLLKAHTESGVYTEFKKHITKNEQA